MDVRIRDCCAEKRAARRNGLFEGMVGDSWYICACRRKDKPLERIFLALEVLLWLTVIAGIAIGYEAWRNTYG